MSSTNKKNKGLILESSTPDSIVTRHIAEEFIDVWNYGLEKDIWFAHAWGEWRELPNQSAYDLKTNIYFWLTEHLPEGFNADRVDNIERLLRYQLANGS